MTPPTGPLERLLADVIGSGPKSAEDMSRTQAREALECILGGDPDPTTLGAFLLANRWKGNTPTELAAYLDVMYERSRDTGPPTTEALDCGANYDGKTSTAVLGVAAGAVAAAAGQPIVIHGGDRLPASHGASYTHVLDRLDVSTSLAPSDSARMLEETGVGFYHQRAVNPAIHALGERRKRMVVRTFFNTIETLIDPAGAGAHLGSFYHLAFAKKLHETIEASEHVAFDRVVLIQGEEGFDDLRPGRTTMAEWSESTLDELPLDPAELGIELEEEHLSVPDVAEDSARLTREVLQEGLAHELGEWVALNGAVRLYAGGQSPTIEAGFDRAREALESGQAADRLAEMEAFEPTTPGIEGP